MADTRRVTQVGVEILSTQEGVRVTQVGAEVFSTQTGVRVTQLGVEIISGIGGGGGPAARTGQLIISM